MDKYNNLQLVEIINLSLRELQLLVLMVITIFIYLQIIIVVPIWEL